jgi:hypothetical protein
VGNDEENVDEEELLGLKLAWVHWPKTLGVNAPFWQIAEFCPFGTNLKERILRWFIPLHLPIIAKN